MEEAAALARRKEIYEALHPETKNGATGRGRPKQKVGQVDQPIESFVNNTSQKTGRSRRTIERSVEIGEALTDSEVEELAATPIADNKRRLKEIADTPPENRRAKIEAAKQPVRRQPPKPTPVVDPNQAAF